MKLFYSCSVINPFKQVAVCPPSSSVLACYIPGPFQCGLFSVVSCPGIRCASGVRMRKKNVNQKQAGPARPGARRPRRGRPLSSPLAPWHCGVRPSMTLSLSFDLFSFLTSFFALALTEAGGALFSARSLDSSARLFIPFLRARKQWGMGGRETVLTQGGNNHYSTRSHAYAHTHTHSHSHSHSHLPNHSPYPALFSLLFLCAAMFVIAAGPGRFRWPGGHAGLLACRVSPSRKKEKRPQNTQNP